MVEAAITLPIMLFILFGSLEFGLLFADYQILLGVTAQAARTASLFQQTCIPPDLEAEIRANIAANETLNLLLADSARTRITFTNLCLPGRFVEVDIESDVRMGMVGGFMDKFGFPGLTDITIHARVRMMND